MSAASRPSGHVAFLFTDLEGSTRAWEQAPAEMNTALVAHDQIMRAAIDDASGAVFSTAGDAFAAAFASCSEALAAAVDAQRRLHDVAWTGGVAPKVRMGIHVGTAFERDENYFGPSVN
ncbi:MAG: adenylate/guanylate cyclase domain-containing protein, partial [Vicinamibacterales bacterium]